MGQVIALRDCQLFELHAEDLAYLSHVGHRQRSVRHHVLEVGCQLLDAEIAGQYRRMAPTALRPPLSRPVATLAPQYESMGPTTPSNTRQGPVQVSALTFHYARRDSGNRTLRRAAL